MKRYVLRYASDARTDLERIIAYGVDHDHANSASYVRALGGRIALLREQPKAGRVGRVKGTREIVLAGTAYIAVYRLDGDDNTITVLRVLHGAQRWPLAEDMPSGS